MEVLFVGAVIPGELCIKYKGCSVAGNKMQLGLIQSLSRIPGCNLNILSTYPIAAYPGAKVLGMRKKNISLPTGEKISSVAFINVFLLKQVSQIIGIYNGLLKWKKSSASRDRIIVCFNAYPEWAIPVLLFSRIYKIHNICLLADLPFHVIKYDKIRQIASSAQIKSTEILIGKFEGLVVLNEEAQKRFAPHLPYCIIDGGINADEYPKPVNMGGVLEKNKKIILFTGALIEYNGIINLIGAIKKIKNRNVIFKFYGDGPLTQFIIDESQTDERIKYAGLVSNEDIIKIQMASSFLINPRPPLDPVSQVTFPSKILEYMMSGTPVLTTRLNGLVDEYKEYLFFIGDDPDTMAIDIENALALDESSLRIKATLAYKYVKENKSWNVQTTKIYNFMRKFVLS